MWPFIIGLSIPLVIVLIFWKQLRQFRARTLAKIKTFFKKDLPENKG